MSLLKPTPGQIADRISILELKIRACLVVHRDSKALRDELDELESYLLHNFGEKLERIASLRSALEITNSKLWNYENEVRSAPEGEKTSRAAKEIAYGNDQRNMLIQTIDVTMGVTSIEDKVYL